MREVKEIIAKVAALKADIEVNHSHECCEEVAKALADILSDLRWHRFREMEDEMGEFRREIAEREREYREGQL